MNKAKHQQLFYWVVNNSVINICPYNLLLVEKKTQNGHFEVLQALISKKPHQQWVENY